MQSTIRHRNSTIEPTCTVMRYWLKLKRSRERESMRVSVCITDGGRERE